MKALLIDEPGKIVIQDRKRPKLLPGELLIKINYIGLCGSDLSTFMGRNPFVQYPKVPGHEISGLIDEIGSKVPADFKLGELVTVIPYTNCGTCSSCKKGRANACRNNQTLGVQRDGAMQEYISIPWQKVLKAQGLKELEMTLVEPLTVGFHAIARGSVSNSDVVAVIGCGMIGAGAIIKASLEGATVIAIDIEDHKLDLAKKLGARHVINSLKKNLHNELMNLTDGEGPDLIIEAAGNPVSYRAAVDEVAFSGRVVCIGYAAVDVSFATKYFVQKELDILGSRNADPNDFKEVISYLKQGTFPIDDIISKKVKPEKVADSLKFWSENPGQIMKILVDFKS